MGVSLGLLMGYFRLADRLLSPIFNGLGSVPPIAWVPFALLWCGPRIGVANGWMSLVAAEMVAGQGSLNGLGFLVLAGQQNLQVELSIAAMAMIGLVGATLDWTVARWVR